MAEDWADWFDLTPTFVAIYASEGMGEFERDAPPIGDGGPDIVLTEADEVYLPAVEPLVDADSEMRLGEYLARRGLPSPLRRTSRRRRGPGTASSVPKQAMDDVDVGPSAQQARA